MQIDGPAKATMANFGTLRIAPDGEARLVAYRSHGFGLVPTLNGATLGASSETGALVFNPEDCQIVIFEMEPQEIEILRQVLSQNGSNGSSLCIVGGEDEEMDRDFASGPGAGGM